MKKHPCDIYKIARQCGVELHDGHEHSPTSRRPRDCYCKPTLRTIGQAHGEGHLKLVLTLMTTNRHNASALYADMITAVSELLIGFPAIVQSADLLDEFNAIDLPALRAMAKTSGLRVETWKQLATALRMLFTEERKAA